MTSRLPRGYTTRPATREDARAVAALTNTCSLATLGRETTSPERLETQMGTPGFSPETDTTLVFSPHGELVAAGFVFDAVPPHVLVEAGCVVHPQHVGKGIGTAVSEWIETRARKTIPRAPPGVRVVLHQVIDDADKAGQTLLERRGYSAVRHFFRMLIEMDGPPPPAVFPDGVRVRTLDPEKDLVAAIVAARDAFQDHWGFVETPLEQEIERWRHRIANDPDFDPTLSFLAVDGEEIAGICCASPRMGTDASTGYVGTLGVRRPWRRQGVALALLRHAFGEFYRRGVKRVALHVDAQSLTGATRLYEKAGMRPDEIGHAYQKELRPGVELATQKLGD